KLARQDGECDGMNEQDCYWAMNEAYGGSHCDTFKQKCTLPVRHRTLRPLAWHFTEKSNVDYFDGTAWATHDHDVAMRHAAQVARYVECMESGDEKVDYAERKEACVAENPVYFGQMDDHQEARDLAAEVDDCRHGLSYVGDGGQDDYGPVNSAGREEKCVKLAETIAERRALDAWSDDDPYRVKGLVHLAQMPEQIVLCHSPVEAGDPEACAPADQRLPAGMTMAECQAGAKAGDRDVIETCRSARFARIGDLRYHAVNVFEEPQSPSFWGIYSDAEDPLTGEAFAASINVWSHVNDLFSQGVIDRVRYVKGEIETSEITEGTYVRDWIKAAEAASGSGSTPRFTRQQLDERLAAAVEVDVDTLHEIRDRGSVDPTIRSKALQLRSELAGVTASQGAADHNSPAYEARRQALLGSQVEAELVDPMMQHIAGTAELGLDQATMQLSSPLRLLDPHVQKQLHQRFEAGLAARGMCIYREAPAPMSLTGLADALERKFEGQWGAFGSGDPEGKVKDAKWANDRAEAMRQYVANRAHYAVIVHEMGHSIGERHNFVSSSDAFNFRPQYWQLRTKNGTVTDECKDYAEDGDSCTGPRWFDPMTEEERENMVWMWMHSSVMDYAGEYTQDMLGLGAYDFAAHRSFYGDTIAVFDDPSYKMKEDRADWMFFKMDSFGGLNGFQPQMTIDDPVEGVSAVDIHYSQYQKHYEVIRDCKEVDVEQYKPASWNEAKQGAWDPVIDGLIVNVDGSYTKCRQQPVDYVSWNSTRFPTMQELQDAGHVTYEPYYRGGPAIDPNSRVRVPYGFATDRWADLGNAAVYRHDNGADNFEIFSFFITQQEVQHIFDNYRRGRQSFSVRGASDRTLFRYNAKIRDGAKGLGLYKSWYVDLAEELNLTHSSFWAFAAANWFPDQILAAGMVFDHFARSFARPEPGDHIRDGNVLRSVEDAFLDGETLVTIPNGATGYFGQLSFGGKLVENRLCETTWDAAGKPVPGCGEYDSEFTMNAGSYYDKAWAGYLMAESEDNFISDSRTDFVDGRYRAVSMADVFPDGYRRWLGQYLTGDIQTNALHVGADDTGTPLIDLEENATGSYRWPTLPLGTVTWWAKEPEVCFPAAGTTVCNTYDAYTSHAFEFDPQTPETTMLLDPQVGWEQQKFLIAYTLLYLPANQKRAWLDMLRLYKLGVEADPNIPAEARIEWYNPQGEVFVARRYGTEEIFGKVVEKGVAARMLQWANELMERAYVGAWDTNGVTYIPEYNPTTGAPIVKFDPTMGSQGPPVNFDKCNSTTNEGCTCEDNDACITLQKYASVPYYLWETSMMMYYGDPDKKGVFD
ncbi:MAG: hypothetical protein KC731_30775, partial [Myxococcales bacterium]|nr:hypothetical protein [Myxococcales bacterium]